MVRDERWEGKLRVDGDRRWATREAAGRGEGEARLGTGWGQRGGQGGGWVPAGTARRGPAEPGTILRPPLPPLPLPGSAESSCLIWGPLFRARLRARRLFLAALG